MKKYLALLCALVVCLTACDRFGAKPESASAQRLVVLSKQYNEIIFALGAQKDIVGVDVSSTQPPEIKKVTTVGYHRALSVEPILALNPSLIIHDNNIGPEHVTKQLSDLKIPMKVFETKADDVEKLKLLMTEMGAYFHQETTAQALNRQLDQDMQVAQTQAQRFVDRPKVLVIHFGRASNNYLVMTKKNVAGRIVEWAGGEMAIDDTKGMKQLSAEIIAAADPDVILLTDFGYDQLGNLQKIKELPGVAATKAAQHDRVYRVEEADLAYLGPRTGKSVQALQKVIHPELNNAK